MDAARMTASIIPFPSPAPFDFQERNFSTIIGVLTTQLPEMEPMARQNLARTLSIAITFNASVSAERALLAVACPMLVEEPR